jgi:hypothetical protein
MVDGAIVSWPGCTSVPVPVNCTEREGFAPLELNKRLPVIIPPDGGANETLKVTLWAAARMSGGLIPLKLNPAPPGVIWEIVRDEHQKFIKI